VPLLSRQLPAYGLGTLPLGVCYSGWGRPPRATALALLRHAEASGVRFFDTADSYFEGGDASQVGYAEALLAEAFSGAELLSSTPSREAPPELLVATKAGMHRVSPLAAGWRPVAFTRGSLRATVLTQKARLGGGTLGMWSFHHVDEYDCEDGRDGLFLGLLAELRLLVEEGHVGGVGLCNASVGHVEKARGVLPVAAVQNKVGESEAGGRRAQRGGVR
jgi:aryl-alcohol dehydrogenase-like predicted oxidoreductase